MAARAAATAGRGAFTETFELFGYALDDYDELFAEKLELLLALRSGRPVTWSGKHRSPLTDVVLHPPTVQQPLPVWLAVGGSRNSFVRAGRLGLPSPSASSADLRRTSPRRASPVAAC